MHFVLIKFETPITNPSPNRFPRTKFTDARVKLCKHSNYNSSTLQPLFDITY